MNTAPSPVKEVETTITPVFVLGLQRTGTTWMGNVLCSHPDIAGIAADDHRGIHESIYFSHFAAAFADLNDEGVRRRYVDYFTASDYYILSDLPPEWLTETLADTSVHAEIFDRMMSAVARRSGARFWVEKSPHHSALAEMLQEALPHARFICVTRPSLTLVRSRLHAYGRTAPKHPKRAIDIARGVIANTYFTRHLKRFAARTPQAIHVDYQTFADDTPSELARISAFLDLDADGFAQDAGYAPNSSFASSADKTRSFSALDRLLVRLFSAGARLIPLSFLGRVQKSMLDRKGVQWPDWCWRRDGRNPPDALT